MKNEQLKRKKEVGIVHIHLYYLYSILYIRIIYEHMYIFLED